MEKMSQQVYWEKVMCVTDFLGGKAYTVRVDIKDSPAF